MPDNQGKPVNFGEVLTSSLAQGLGKFHAQKIANQEQDQQNALMAFKMQNDQMEREARMAALRANMAHVDAQTRELTQKMAIPYEQRMQMEAQQKEAEMRLKAQLDLQAQIAEENRARTSGFVPTGWKKPEAQGAGATSLKPLLPVITNLIGQNRQISATNAKLKQGDMTNKLLFPDAAPTDTIPHLNIQQLISGLAGQMGVDTSGLGNILDMQNQPTDTSATPTITPEQARAELERRRNK